MKGTTVFMYSALLFTIGYVRFRFITYNTTVTSERPNTVFSGEYKLKTESVVTRDEFLSSNGNETFGCPNKVQLASGLPRTALVSFAGSGNTWIRHLLETMTGLATGSEYNDTALKNIFHEEGRTDGSVLVVKTHATSPSEQWARAIILIRNPFKCLISEYNRRMSKNHTGIAETFEHRVWEHVYWKFETRWVQTIRSWLQLANVQVVFYEHLLRDMGTELRRMLHFLRVPGNVSCALKHSEGSFHRNAQSNVDFETLFSADKTTAMNNSIDYIFKQLSDRFPRSNFRFMSLWKR